MNNNKFIEEDYERLWLNEEEYIRAERKQMEEEWMHFEDNKKRKPAKIKFKKIKTKHKV